MRRTSGRCWSGFAGRCSPDRSPGGRSLRDSGRARHHAAVPIASETLLFGLALVASLGCGVNAGFFFAFSVVVMRALAERPAPEGISTMQAINVVVLNRWFLGAFFGTALISIAALVVAAGRWSERGSAWLLAGALLYLVGTLLVTMLFNVPRNESLKRLSPGAVESQAYWNDYLASWTAWNHVRAGAALLAAACFGMAMNV